MTDGKTEPLMGKGMYLLRNSDKPIDDSKANDGTLLIGEIGDDPLAMLERQVRSVYADALHERTDWGRARKEDTEELEEEVERFTEGIDEAMKGRGLRVKLVVPDPAKYDYDDLIATVSERAASLSPSRGRRPTMSSGAAGGADDGFSLSSPKTGRGGRQQLLVEPDTVVEFMSIIRSWCESIGKHLEEDEAGSVGPEDGPRAILDWWKARRQRLTSITEQLRSQGCTTVVVVLSAVLKAPASERYPVDLAECMREWKDVNMAVTEAANEAKDNVNYLSTLERFIEPLYSGTPVTIIDSLPALLNSVKMINAIARYFNTRERMTDLLARITSQMISNCRSWVLAIDPEAGDKLWKKTPNELVARFRDCMELNRAYQETYRTIKEKLANTPRAKQFDFSEQAIFSRFDLFCRRAAKLAHMFATVDQFRTLAAHELEGMESVNEAFRKVVNGMQAKRHASNLLAYSDPEFDRDFVEFNVRVNEIEAMLQQFINASFEAQKHIEPSLALLRKYRSILTRPALAADLDDKLHVIFQRYGSELERVQRLYEEQKPDPPRPRNLPPVAGNITWARHLFKRIEGPMRTFESHQAVLASRDAKRIVRLYNRVARGLVAFEYLWHKAWVESIEGAKAGLQATLVIRHPADGRLYVNFDPEILQLIREAKCLSRMGLPVPESARMVLIQEDKFKAYFNDLSHILREYARITDKIIPVTRALLQPALEDLEYRLRPGMVTLTWTSMNIDSYKAHVHTGLRRLEELVSNVNDIIENRIEHNLTLVSKTVLVELPEDRSFKLDEFVDLQTLHTRDKSEFLRAKNVEVESAVEDLLGIVHAFGIDPHIAPVADEDFVKMRRHYNRYMYHALLNCTKTSLNLLKKRVAARAGSMHAFYLHRPFFEVDVHLAAPNVRLVPDVDRVQSAINRAAVAVLSCMKKVDDWPAVGATGTFFDRITQDMDIVRVVLLLTGSVHGARAEVDVILNSFRRFEWLWKKDADAEYEEFMKTNPGVDDYDRTLQHFLELGEEIDEIKPVENIGALMLRTSMIKTQLHNDVRRWMRRYNENLHRLARFKLNTFMEYVKATTSQLGREVDSLNSLAYVMQLLREVRHRQSGILGEVEPILDMYTMLERYGATITQEEQDQRTVMFPRWKELVDRAEAVTDKIAVLQAGFRTKLLRDVKEFKDEVINFRKDYDDNGPMVEGIEPSLAMERLKRFEDEFEMRDRKRELYQGGERLFNMPVTEYPQLERTKKELGLLGRLYGLYRDVMDRFEEWSTILWSKVVANIDEMTTEMEGLHAKCRKMPGRLRGWQAYKDLERKIENFMTVLPLLRALSAPVIRPRHWDAVIAVTSHDLDWNNHEFRLSELMAAPLVEFADEITEITDGAIKEDKLERDLTDLFKFWDEREFSFAPWKTRGVEILVGEKAVMEELDEAQMQLQTWLTSRHVKPFRDDAESRLRELSTASDTLGLWAKVQQTWCSLESVFLGGDIAKQMPMVAKKFQKVDKEFVNIMIKAKEDKIVVKASSNEILQSLLPQMNEELQVCQNKLEKYLEQKRAKFPRFYFVSDPLLLQILSKGSDLNAIQQYYQNVFAAVSSVVHDPKDITHITTIKSFFKGTYEEVELTSPAKAQGNIEEWLSDMLRDIQQTMKTLCEEMANEVYTIEPLEGLRPFVDGQIAQYSLLGIQFLWTRDIGQGLDRIRTERTKAPIQKAVRDHKELTKLMSSWCLTDLGSKMNRIKIETLITIQVHQKDVADQMGLLVKNGTVTSADDFAWLQQARFYWESDEGDQVSEEGRVRISVTDIDFNYQYEYLGTKERLVITPLTDRCYITLAQALGMCMGGAPAGPAGTGKTETVKDMGNTLGIFVVVTNCSDQMRYSDCAKIFKGLCQSGLWGCFDEFNRITLPVLSVVAQQVQSINDAKRAQVTEFEFLGEPGVKLNPVCGYFITMNPGYAGRQELPENLKALFRGVAMMVPDREIIIKVKLCSVGYTTFPELSKKFFMCYSLCEQQLSKQKHYDFGLRNILSVLRTAGATKRANTDKAEEELLYQTLRDMNLSKMVAQDVPLFESMLADLFPKISNPAKQAFEDVEDKLKTVIEEEGLTAHPDWVLKVLQLHATCLVRHGIMLTGPTGGGKTKISKALRGAMSLVTGTPYREARLNPKAVAASELYGHPDPRSGEWVKGIFAALWERYNNASLSYITWIMEDGPVDAIWIEDLNTVLDDNRILTLSNGDRFPMTDNTKIMFENETLKNASPATVSRAGIIYVSETDLDWLPVVTAWIMRNPEDSPLRAILPGLFHKLLGECTPEHPGHLFRFLIRETQQVMLLSRVGAATASMRMFDALLPQCEAAMGAPSSDVGSTYAAKLERLLVYCISWGIAGLLESEDRRKFDNFFRGITREMPTADPDRTIFDMKLDLSTLEWTPWRPPEWEYPSDQDPLDFSNLLVPTMDSTRNIFLLETMQNINYPVLMVGGPGTAKTSTALMYFESFDPAKRMLKRVNFSSVTTPRMLQDSVESSLDKRGGRNFGPPGGKSMTVFIDDVSMPEINTWGDQPTNEMTRQLIEMGGLYFLDKDKRGDFKGFKDLSYVAAMVHPGGGRNDVPARLKRHFFVFNLVLPAIQSINDLYGQMLAGRFPDGSLSEECIDHVVHKLTKGTISLWNIMKAKMLPTPAKFHYIFNMRDLSRVFQGIMLTPLETIKTGGTQVPSNNDSKNLLNLWRHECSRVFQDKLTNNADKERYTNALNTVTKDTFGEEMAAHAMETEHFFVDFFRDDVYDEDEVLVEEAPKVYEPADSLDVVRERVKMYMKRHNDDNPSTPLNLVLFEDAMRHLIRISRIIQMPTGSALLVGVGGSGKQSLTRLAAYIARHFTFQITLTKTYNVASLLEDLKVVYEVAGHQRRPVTFILTDAEIKSEEFLEYINSVLMTGEVAGLFPKDEIMAMTADLQPAFVKERPELPETQDNLTQFFFDLARNNLHMVLCMSPVNPKFPERARKFPGLISATSIDWFLPWPEEALISVSRGLLEDFKVECDDDTKESLIEHVGLVHNVVVGVCDEYYSAMRRRVYQTPKSFLSFIKNYKTFYGKKLGEIDQQEERINKGLSKLIQGAKDVEKLKGEIAEENKKVMAATVQVNELLAVLQVDQAEATKKSKEVAAIASDCEAEAARISEEKAAAMADLAKAQPIVDAANEALSKIKSDDITFIKAMKKPSDIIRLVMDGVLLLLFRPIDVVSPCSINVSKEDWQFVTPSWASAMSLLADSSFLGSVLHFDPDAVNEETVELISAYVDLPYFSPEVAGKAANAAEGLATWVAAMKDYFYASKIVKPKLEAVKIAEADLEVAEANLGAARKEEASVQARLAELQSKFDAAMDDKQEKEDRCAKLQAKMEQAEALINGLSGERTRWTNDSKTFAETKRRLVGDVAVACAFMSYCGPFNSTFRSHLVDRKFIANLKRRQVPVSTGLDVISFLTNASEIGDWNLSGLPTDPLSVQNGILVTRAERYPLLVDPQGQAFTWITNKERTAGCLPDQEVTAINSSKLKDRLEFCMSDGLAFVVIGVQEELDPLLDPILEKQIIQKSKTRKVVKIADNEVDLDDNFRMYFLTRLPNPHFSPELQAKTTVVDFTVTMKGLEDQLLGIVIKREQRALEEQLEQVLAEVNANRKSLSDLDDMLLAKLSGGGGNLLEEEGLIEMLAETKAKAAEVSEKLQRAEETRAVIAEQREQYRPVATRGSVLYFSVVDMSIVNVMYQTSLAQFVSLFQQSITEAPKSKLTNKRVDNVIDTMTYIVYRYVNKGLYEQHKLLYVFLLTIKVLVRAGTLEQSDVSLFLRGGAALDISSVRAKPKWVASNDVWLNVIALSEQVPFFRALPDNIARAEPQWRGWYESNEPENAPVPDFDLPLTEDKETGPWLRLQLVRALRPDRTLLGARSFIRDISCMGSQYIEPVTDTVDEIYDTMDAHTPVIYLLSTGADPTEAIQQLAKRRKNHVSCISMGEGQEVRAKNDIRAASVGGSWVLLQNCELGLGLMDEMEDMIKDMHDVVHPDFRLFITALPDRKFPLGLLQMSTKVTNEPPNGLRAGLVRSYTVMVDQDRLERIDSPSQAPMWRRLLFSMCFLHSIVQERRKFDSLGWCIPYEYNSGDLSACIQFLERHLYAGPLSWPTVQYMVAEAQYGGKITDDMDRRLFTTYTMQWISSAVLEDGFTFNPSKPIQPIPNDFVYAVLDATEVEKYREYASSFPDIDSPELFGLHPNADITFRNKEVKALLDTLSETQPRDTGGSAAGKSMDDVVTEKAQQLLDEMPDDYVEDVYLEQIRKLGGLSRPYNILLFQEIQRFQAVIAYVRNMLQEMQLAIKGDVVMTNELQVAMGDVFDARVPQSWLVTPGGDEFSWLFPMLGSWFRSLIDRDQQFRSWVGGDVPMSYWMTGFSNPQGFLTAMKQTECRKHKRDGWALDDIEYFSVVSNLNGPENVRERPADGVYAHGVFLDGARWDRKGGSLAESEPKKLNSELPILHISVVLRSKLNERRKQAGRLADVPLYRYPVRQDRYLVLMLDFVTKSHPSRHWILRGVAALLVASA